MTLHTTWMPCRKSARPQNRWDGADAASGHVLWQHTETWPSKNCEFAWYQDGVSYWYMQIWRVRFWRWKHIIHTLQQTYSLSPWTWHLFLIWLQIYSPICVFANPTRSKKHCLRFTFWRKEWWNDYEGFNASFPHRRHQRFIHSTFKDAAGLPAFWTLLSKDFMSASCNQI